jgi:hypothetical protein
MSNQHANFYDGIPMRGDLTIIIRDAKTRKKIRKIEIRNKITFLAADMLVELIAQRTPTADPAPAQQRLYSMRMGLSNTPAARSDTNLGTFEIGKVLTDVNKITGVPGELELTAELEAGEANGVTLQEAGLFTAGTAESTSDVPVATPGGTRIFSRQIHPAIPKTSAIVLDYSWRIAFTA